MFSTQDTIVAIATPPGRGGIGVVRLSGPAAHDIARGLITHEGPLQPRHATLTRIRVSATTVRLKADTTYGQNVASGFSRTDQNVASGFSRTVDAIDHA